MEALNYSFPPITRGQPAAFDIILKTRDIISQQLKVQDLTGAVVEWRLKLQGQTDIVKTTADGSLTVTPLAGRVRWAASPSDTAAYEAGDWAYTVRVTLPDRDAETYLSGFITFKV